MKALLKNYNFTPYLSLIMSSLLWLMMLTRVLYFYFTSDAVRVSVVPDDAFYYIQLAKHHIHEGGWHFDGQASTTGFHLLYAYFLVFIYTLSPTLSWSALYLIIGFSATTCIALAAYFSMQSTRLLFGLQSSLWSIIPFVTISVLIQSNMMMESWLVIFFSAFGLYRFLSYQKCTEKEQFILILIGLLGSLSRSDFGLFPGLLFIMCLLSFKSWQYQEIKRSFSLLCGAVLGLCVLWLHTYHTSGHITQASAETKFYWSSLRGHDIHIPWQFLKSIVIPHEGDLNPSRRFYTLLLLTVLMGLFWGRQNIKKNHHAYVTILAACITIIGYTFVYRYNCAALQIWYAANYITPLCIVFAGFGSLLCRIPLIKNISAIVTMIVLTTYLQIAFKALLVRPWLHQAGMMYAGLSLKEMKVDTKFAAWNAGIISYFSELPIVNLDGLVNDEVLSYIQQNRLLAYIQKKHIDYLVDYEYMLKNTIHNTRGGYTDGKLEHCLTPLNAIDGPAPEWPPSPEHSKLKLFQLNADCVS